ncbi:inositol 1,4,5-trisphosphate receptor-interacting protein-like 1 [Chiroxiphia lanceolata]|uniref:inositol 1,4,5-trisphosphate receptor-interacting protein-like 1 n=1 Tax=Chiroxiphia lanceolata TaxID=296741 RepID=UPI0013CEC057|nr:inositol 1,4,5-trisphosphate receptor-interacting protein-like 1 [Chiroxiphia lanceolata]
MSPAGNAAPVEPGQVAMAAKMFLFVLLQTLIQYPQMVGDGLDEVTRVRMELRAELLDREMTRLLQELEQSSLERSVRAWGALLWAALQQGDFWTLAGLLGLLLWLWFIHSRRSRQPANNGREEEEEEGDNVVIVQQEDNEDRNEVRNVGENEEEAGNDGAIAENGNDDGNAVEEEDDAENDIGRILEGQIQWPIQDLERGCEMTSDIMDIFISVFGHLLLNSSYPVLQRAIGVGSAFEGWSPREEDVVYRVLVPLTSPPGHTFHLEMDTSGHIPGRNFFIRVEPVCTCPREQQDENVLCSLHHPEEEQRRNEEPNFLNTLCTGSYLDVEKTARWFYQLVRAAWVILPHSQSWQLVLLPSSRCCKFKVTRGTQRFTVEILFGVQQGVSDIYVSSQPTEALFTPSTMWPETYAVAEMKFFRHIAKQAPPDSWHLKCLQVLARAVVGIGFSTYMMKTIVMHLLNTIPMSRWGSRYILLQLEDSIEYLRFSLLEKRLDHFIVGNQRVPEVISLPPEVQTAEPLNLFYHLAQNPVAHTQAISEYRNLRYRLKIMLLEGH